MIALKNLVIGIANHFYIFINKAPVDGCTNGCKMYLRFQVLEYAV